MTNDSTRPEPQRWIMHYGSMHSDIFNYAKKAK